ncbi:hypothetical protein ANACOL_02772 [Anaerotruncus colihominis DSM 17241]|uniref:Uncharacterized protein n=1 Tax=Anaerotruncus colihominis DSM 17241 TaxID=445972 RepID=B0PDY7_9FIRM|nr:hypothetical protein ANACOL_02772 [Anaerotruncus colihominis DSM 17241]
MDLPAVIQRQQTALPFALRNYAMSASWHGIFYSIRERTNRTL